MVAELEAKLAAAPKATTGLVHSRLYGQVVLVCQAARRLSTEIGGAGACAAGSEELQAENEILKRDIEDLKLQMRESIGVHAANVLPFGRGRGSGAGCIPVAVSFATAELETQLANDLAEKDTKIEENAGVMDFAFRSAHRSVPQPVR